LLVSHKIAGPMFRFEKDIDRIVQGDLKSRISIRKKDQFQELAISLNRMVESLNNNLSDIRIHAHALAEKKDLPETCRREILQLNEKINTHFKL
ncbi:MAG: methyl-accepting chemotaxis protein, partial [Desulfobacteraceae bacterium]|nr:methyl-accepting chemotaxis protein [Desulfobacteraceae bacterium]